MDLFIRVMETMPSFYFLFDFESFQGNKKCHFPIISVCSIIFLFLFIFKYRTIEKIFTANLDTLTIFCF